VSIHQAPVPGPGGAFRLPFPAGELAQVLVDLERQVVGSGAFRGVLPVEPAAARLTPEEVGDRLFTALFQGAVRDSFLQSRERVRSRAETGLRLRLVIDPETPGGALLAALPWELLYRREARTFLSRDPRQAVVRFLVTSEAPNPSPFEEPLRILLASSLADGWGALDLEGEELSLREAWPRGSVSVLPLPQATREALAEALRRERPHVLHFMGHGAFDPETEEGGLILRGPHGEARLTTARALADLARSAPSLRLVCLNACESARLPRRRGRDPFSGLAAALVMAGVPAVVAMQFPISDRASLLFSSAFYRALAAGEPVDAAVAVGRMAIFGEQPSSWEWATPALYLAVKDGRLFGETAGSAPGSTARRQPTARGAQEPGRSTFITDNNTVVYTEGDLNVGQMTIGGGSTQKRREG
jgi:hypothetical protein